MTYSEESRLLTYRSAEAVPAEDTQQHRGMTDTNDAGVENGVIIFFRASMHGSIKLSIDR
ncbi:MAG: hypothetical protein AVO35_11820 [Candidatus Aegiribacteria sp. MLS_C]|nr:MAG: hypothetical protein AVO35_11820 [Candidatus Aegiribacteria sp. MLS_C]